MPPGGAGQFGGCAAHGGLRRGVPSVLVAGPLYSFRLLQIDPVELIGFHPYFQWDGLPSFAGYFDRFPGEIGGGLEVVDGFSGAEAESYFTGAAEAK